MNNDSIFVIIPAAGIGARMQVETPKQYLPLRKKTILEHSIAPFLQHPAITQIIVALREGDEYWRTLPLASMSKIHTVSGGAERCHSVLNGLRCLETIAKPQDWVLVHDAVRPCLTRADLDKLITTLIDHPTGGLLGAPVYNTLKKARADQTIINTLERHNVWQAFTPQMFRYTILLTALTKAITNNATVTDEAAAVEALGLAPQLVMGVSSNIKITCPHDLQIAECLAQITLGA